MWPSPPSSSSGDSCRSSVEGTLFGDCPDGYGAFGIQIIGILAIGAFTFIFSFILFYIIKVTMGLRVSEEEEEKGLDIMEHELHAYS